MRSLARELLDGREDVPVRLVYGTATATNTVRVDGETTAVVLPVLNGSVSTGQRCAVLKSGGDRLILGAVGAGTVGGVTTATSDASGFIVVTHALPFTPTGVVGTPRSTNHVSCRIDEVGATTFKYRAFDGAGAGVGSASITFQWIAFK